MKEKLTLATILLTAAVIRIFIINKFGVPFAADMGRDLLWAKDISFYHIPTLIGPLGSIWGVYFGPFWFYFLSIPLFITQGHPLSAVYTTSTVIIICGFLSYVLFKNYLKSFYALFLAVIFLFSSIFVDISTFAFHANVLPIFALLMIYFCFLAVVKNIFYLPLSFLMVSLMFHADPAPAVVFSFIPPSIFLIFKLFKQQPIKVIYLSGLAYIVPFIPQIVFELRNNFIQARSLIAYFKGENPSLSGQLPLAERILNRLSVYFDFTKSGFAGGNSLIAILLIVFVGFGLFKLFKSNKDKSLNVLLKITSTAFVLSFLIFTLIFTVELKTWYLYGVSSLIALLILIGLLGYNSKITASLFILVFTILNFSTYIDNERIQKVKSDPALLSNQLIVMDLIYKHSQNQPYSVYVFTPSIYDYNYQYLFWWQGVIKKKDLPDEFAYLPNKPEYVRNKIIYQKNQKQSETVFLIIEQAKENQYYTSQEWIKNFDNFPLVWEGNINKALKIQKRTNENINNSTQL